MLTLDEIAGDDPIFAIRTDPELGVNLVFGNQLTPENVAHEQIVIHRVCDDMSDGG